ncbi:MAG: hypothetical protein M3430_10055 [Acidobacteriota bacterium]|nr:hypothetical protein [Acidobacteriota bacterium]
MRRFPSTRLRLLLLTYSLFCVAPCFAQNQTPRIKCDDLRLAPALVTYDPKAWREIISQPGGFSILFPGLPCEQAGTVSSNLGPLEIHLYTMVLQQGDGFASCAVSYNDMPVVANGSDQIKRALDGGRNGLIANNNGKLVSESEISLGQYTGRSIKIEMPDHIFRGKMYVVRNRIYQVVVRLPKDADTSKTTRDNLSAIADRFLNSLKVVDQ